MMTRMQVERNSDTLELGGARRMTGSAGTVLDVMVECDSLREEGCDKSPGDGTFSGLRWFTGDFTGGSKSEAGVIL